MSFGFMLVLAKRLSRAPNLTCLASSLAEAMKGCEGLFGLCRKLGHLFLELFEDWNSCWEIRN